MQETLFPYFYLNWLLLDFEFLVIYDDKLNGLGKWNLFGNILQSKLKVGEVRGSRGFESWTRLYLVTQNQ